MPLRPLVSIWVTTPFLMCSISGSCMSVSELAASVRFLNPMRAITSMTWFTTKSPFLKW